ncbi:MAG TPA: glycosyl hydrolase family 8 [Mobilitalea sp.]|nr:glycosyl hydrolase family 8 [Mobilitalea sp.]
MNLKYFIIAVVLFLGMLLFIGCTNDLSPKNDKGSKETDEITVTVAPENQSSSNDIKDMQKTGAASQADDITAKANKEAIIRQEDNYVGAYDTKEYRNVFQEYGYTDSQIQYKLDTAWNTLFYGNSTEKIYYEADNDEAYILDTGNLDVRSEGMSYGMMMCVQMDKQEEFDKIWKWAKNHMQITEGPNEGYFRWSMQQDGTSNSNGPAPDGEEYFAMALFFASHRWGDKEAPFDYSAQAKYILHQALHQEDDGSGDNMWNLDNKLIKFVPNSTFTDPSYHLPHFYELFALWAYEEDREFFQEAAAASRKYLQAAVNDVTGLAPEYATYEGVPVSNNGGHDYFFSDAYRVAGNIGLDYLWFAADPWQQEMAGKIQAFFVKEGIGKHYSKYTVDGTADTSANYQATGLVAMNAMASLASDGKDARVMIEDLWSRSPATGKWRYYDDCLYFFSILSLSGNYRIWE